MRLAGLRTWRYFREFSSAETLWLIPDNVQVEPPSVAMRLSSTNLGLLFNSILAAHELGFLTIGEYAESIERTMRSAQQLPRYQGHFYNWYDLETRQPLEPRYVSTVDSGNLAASLWTLKQSCLGLRQAPLFPDKMWQGIRDHITLLAESEHDAALPPQATSGIRELAAFVAPLENSTSSWIGALPWLEQEVQRIERALRGSRPPSSDSPLTPEPQLVGGRDGGAPARRKGSGGDFRPLGAARVFTLLLGCCPREDADSGLTAFRLRGRDPTRGGSLECCRNRRD